MMNRRRYPLGLHIKVLWQNPELAYKLTTYPLRMALLSFRVKILEKRIALRDYIKEIRSI